MSSTVTLSKNFEIELEDNTTINIQVCIEATTEDEDFEASRQIKIVTYDNVLDPIQDLITQMLSDIDDEDEDPEQKELEVIEFYKQGGHKQEVGDLLTADDYPECAE
jgi:hypothetical protein